MRLQLQDVHRDYPVGSETVHALAGVTLSFDEPQFVAVVGPSGAGKSTLLHLIGGLDVATSGTVTAEGTDLSTLDDEALARYRRRRVGFVFQSFNLLARLSAEENVAVPCLLDGVPPRKARQRAREALALAGLADLARRRIPELSGGQMQRVAIARALVMDPPLVLADEPTGNLDSAAGEEIVSVLRSRVREGRMVVMVTHNERAAAAGDRVVSLADGRLIGERPLPPGREPAGAAGAAEGRAS